MGLVNAIMYKCINEDIVTHRSSHPEVFLTKGTLKICFKFTREHSCRTAISIKFIKNEVHNV